MDVGIRIYGAAAVINAQGDFVQSITVVIGDFDLEFHICAAVDSAATILMNAGHRCRQRYQPSDGPCRKCSQQ